MNRSDDRAMYIPSPSAGRLLSSASWRGLEGDRVLLRPSGDGWSLVSLDGRVLVRGSGSGARRSCLEYARAAGVLTILN